MAITSQNQGSSSDQGQCNIHKPLLGIGKIKGQGYRSSRRRGETVSTPAEYEAAVKYAEEHGHWSLHTALVEDGFDPKVDYRNLIEDEPER